MDSGTIVKRIRATDGLSRAELARLADLSPSTVSRIEKGVLDPTWSTLQKLLEATGMVINGATIVSAGDPSATAAARDVLERRPEARTSRWTEAWRRAGWVTDALDPVNVLRLAIAAGNAAKFSRRKVPPLYVQLPDQTRWQDLPRALGEAGIEYVISGLVATSDDRTTVGAALPIVYVRDPRAVVCELGLERTGAMRGTMLLAPSADEMEDAVEEDGLWFAARAQAMLDAFAAGGRQPDKAESLALSWAPGASREGE